MARATEPGELPHSLTRLGIPLAGLLLIALFTYLRFPYDVLRDRIVSEASRAGDVRIAIEEMGPGLQLAGPGVTARSVTATPRGGESLRLERVFLRPSWSTSWFRGVPAIHTEALAAKGSQVDTHVCSHSTVPCVPCETDANQQRTALVDTRLVHPDALWTT